MPLKTLITASAINAEFAARYPNASSKVGSLHASAETDPGTVGNIEASGVQTWAPISGALKTVKALIYFKVRGKDIFEGSLLEVPEADAKALKHAGRVVDATAEEIAEANKPAKAK